MGRTGDNPDRNFSADGDPEKREAPKNEAKGSDPAPLIDETAEARIGKLIAKSLSQQRKPKARG